MQNPYIEAIKADGLQVWMRKLTDSYCYVTDGTSIAYMQWSDNQPKVSTVHKPNRTTGTGFSFADSITPQLIREAMKSFAPSWATTKDRESIHKYKDWDDFHNTNDWNKSLIQI